MRRTDIENGEADTLAGNPASPFGPPSGPTENSIIPFPRRATAAALGSAGCSETSSGHPSFQPLGSIVRAVVLRLQDDRVRLNVLVPGTLGNGGKPGTSDDGSLGG